MASVVTKTSTPALTPLSGSYDTGGSQGVATGGLTFSRVVSRVNEFLEGKLDPTFGVDGRADGGSSTPSLTPLSGSYDTGASKGVATGGLTFSRRARVYVKMLTPSKLPAGLGPSSLAATAVFGTARLVDIAPPSLVAPATFGVPLITVEILPSSLAAAAAFGAPVVHQPGIVLASLVATADFTSTAALAETPGLIVRSLRGQAVFGPPRISESSLIPPSVVGTAVFGAVSVGSRLETSSLAATANFGGPTLTSSLVQILSVIGFGRFGSPRIAGADQAFGLYIAGVLRNDVFAHSGFDIQLSMNGQNSMRFEVVDESGSYRPAIGEGVEFYLGAELLFAGFVESLDEGAPSGAESLIRISVHANGMSSLLHRRVVYGRWDGDSRPAGAAFIASDLTIRFLEKDGVSTLQTALSQKASGVLDFFILEPQTAFEAYNRISSETGIDWYMDERKVVRWIDPDVGTGPAPFSIDQSLNEQRLFRDSVRVQTLAGQYRNRTFVQLSRGFPLFTEEAISFLPQFEGPVYNLTYPVTSTPTILITGTLGTHTAAVILGPLIPAVGWDFFWQFGESFITMNPNAPFRTVGDAAYIGAITKVEITYAVPDGVTSFVSAEDPAQIAARQLAEGGGSGLWESIENQTDVEDAEQGRELAAALNARYAATGMPRRLTYQTDVGAEIRPGQLQSVALTRPLASGDFLIESVTFAEAGAGLRAGTPFLRATVVAVSNRSLDAARQRIRMGRPKTSRTITFNLAESISGLSNPGLAVGEDVASGHPVISEAGLLVEVSLTFKTAPVGSDVIIDVKRQASGETDWISIFDAIEKVVVRDGSTASALTPVSPPRKVNRGDLLRVDVEQVGSTTPGSDGVLAIKQSV